MVMMKMMMKMMVVVMVKLVMVVAVRVSRDETGEMKGCKVCWVMTGCDEAR